MINVVSFFLPFYLNIFILTLFTYSKLTYILDSIFVTFK